MRAVTWHGKRDVRVDTVPDPTIEQPTDAIVRVTSSGICGSDLHLYEVMGPFMTEGDVLGHEPMGIVEAVGTEVAQISVGDRVVVPFNISCGHCYMCEGGLQSQCETTQVRSEGKGAAERGPDSVIDAVGMEAHGAPVAKVAHQLVGLLPDAVAEKLMQTGGIDRLAALHFAIDVVRRGGTISLSGVYGGMVDPMPMFTLFDKQISLRMGQANVRRWIDDILPLLSGDEDPLGVESFATHRLALDDAPKAYERFQRKQDNHFKVLLQP